MCKKRERRYRFLDYAPPIVAFIAAVAAVVGSPKWNIEASGFSKITPFGWMVLAIGLLALITSMMRTDPSRSSGWRTMRCTTRTTRSSGSSWRTQ